MSRLNEVFPLLKYKNLQREMTRRIIPDLFDGFGGPSEKSGESEDAFEGDSLLLNTRLSNEYWVGEVGSDEEDPFAEIDEGFDEMGISREKNGFDR